MQKALETAERDLEKAKEESSRSSAETERLLQLVQMTQEEQNSKEKQIRELQEWVLSQTGWHLTHFLSIFLFIKHYDILKKYKTVILYYNVQLFIVFKNICIT